IAEIKKENLIERSAALGNFLLEKLREELPSEISNLEIEIRGLGLMAGIELREKNNSPATSASLGAIKKLLQRGFIFLPEGEHANVISFTPPLTISHAQLSSAIAALKKVLTTDEHG